jgi:hypothetical protein
VADAIEPMIPKLVEQMKHAKLLVVALLLAACSSGPSGIRVVNGGTSAVPTKQGAVIRNFTGDEISKAVIGKTFQFTRKGASGFVVYNADGTLDVQDDQKGTTKGTWQASGEQYCETYKVGTPAECGVFKYTGDAYFAANSRLVEMKI